MGLRHRTLLLAVLVGVVIPIGASTAAGPLFSENFEGSLATQSTGGTGGRATGGTIVADPLRSSNHALSFTHLAAGGDIWSKPIGVSKTAKYRLSFDYLGKPGSGGGIIGVSLGTPDHHRWLVGTAGGKGAGEKNILVLDGKWHKYNFDFSPGDHTWYTPDGARAVDPGAITALRIMIEANWGVPGDAYFDNISLSQCAASCSGGGNEEPVKIDIRFHANSLPTAPPSDGGQCTPGPKAAIVLGSIQAQITPNGDHQGGGSIADHPHLSRCRVPAIKLAVDHVQLAVLTPSKVLRVTLRVHIDAEGVHRPGQCKVGTTGTITAVYDETSRAANSLRNDRVTFAFGGACTAHNHTITNNLSSVTAHASGSTWVTVFIGCLGPGYSPRNCDA